MNEQNRLTGEELKKLIVNGKLPDEYISEDNVNALIDYEFELMEDDEYYDTSIIGYCADLMAEKYSDGNYEKRKRETWKKIQAQIKPQVKGKKIAYEFGRIAIAAVVILVSVHVVSVSMFGFNVFDWTKDRFLDLLGIETQHDDLSIFSSNSREYKTIEEFELGENINIITPIWLPNDIALDFINYSHDYANEHIDLIYSDKITSLSVKLNTTLSNTDDTKIYKNNDILFYVFAESNVIWWEYDGDFYNLTCGFDIDDYADEIIRNIK